MKSQSIQISLDDVTHLEIAKMKLPMGHNFLFSEFIKHESRICLLWSPYLFQNEHVLPHGLLPGTNHREHV
jgi:hypothetical protein